MNAPGRVLVVDDHPVNAALVNAFFKRGGWATRMVNDGALALEELARQPYDLVLLDISMPGLSGIDVCRAIRARPDWAGLRVVAYTAHALAEEHAALREAGFDDILTKPVDRRVVNDVLARLRFAAL